MSQQDFKNILIKIDLDGVIRNWNESLITEYKKRYSDRRVLYPFHDFDLRDSFPDEPDIVYFFKVEAAKEIYSNAKPYPKAIEFLEIMLSRYPNVWLVTTQFTNTAYPTIEWMRRYIPSYNNLPVVFSSEKGAVGNGKFERTILIDDAPHNLNDQIKNGGIALCFGQLYNNNHADSYRWECVFGGRDFSIEKEPERIQKQYELILDYLKYDVH
jgi:5'(3')-deoxyribonucleotidase